MPAKRKERCRAMSGPGKVDPVNTFDAVRFRALITVAMRVILIRDSIAMWGRPSSGVPAGPQAPIRCTVNSGPRRLDARIAVPAAPPVASVLLLHGIGERLEYWSGAQQLLAGHGIASLLIDYSGYGASEGAITPAKLRQDVLAGYAELQRLATVPRPPFVLGLSLGSGVAADAAPYLQPAASGLILCEAFSSLRAAAAAVCDSLPWLKYLSSTLAKLMPDLYRTASTIAAVRAPVLIVHSDTDELFPPAMAHEIHATARRNPAADARLAILSGYAHNDAYLRPSSGYWQPILDFIAGGSNGSSDRTAPLSKS
jgi:pimeloyl-ACP methyl ester carboxylesterase